MKNAKIFLMATAISLMLSMGGSKALAWFEGYGSIVPNSDVAGAYESYRADPDLVYYFSGPSNEQPDAIIGINKAYTLDSSLWKKITITPVVFKNLVSGMQSTASEASQFLHGFAILDDKGMPIGTWYSPLRAPTFVRMAGGKTVDIPQAAIVHYFPWRPYCPSAGI